MEIEVMSLDTASKIVECLKERGDIRITDIIKQTNIKNITSVKNTLTELERLGLISSKDVDNTKLYSLSNISLNKRIDTYFGLSLSKEDENLINYLYTKIRQEWILNIGKEPSKIQVQKTLAKINTEFNLNLPIGWYMYGLVCVKIYNPKENYFYNTNLISSYIPTSISIMDKFIKNTVNIYSGYSISQLKNEQYKDYPLYKIKEEVWSLFATKNTDVNNLFIEKVDKKINEFFKELIDKIDSQLYNKYFLLIKDYFDMTAPKDEQTDSLFMDAYHTFWNIVALHNYKESLSSKYSKEELDSTFDNIIKISSDRFYEIYNGFYDLHKPIDFIDEDDEKNKQISRIMSEEDQKLKKTGKFDKNQYYKNVMERLEKEIDNN